MSIFLEYLNESLNKNKLRLNKSRLNKILENYIEQYLKKKFKEDFKVRVSTKLVKDGIEVEAKLPRKGIKSKTLLDIVYIDDEPYLVGMSYVNRVRLPAEPVLTGTETGISKRFNQYGKYLYDIVAEHLAVEIKSKKIAEKEKENRYTLRLLESRKNIYFKTIKELQQYVKKKNIKEPYIIIDNQNKQDIRSYHVYNNPNPNKSYF